VFDNANSCNNRPQRAFRATAWPNPPRRRRPRPTPGRGLLPSPERRLRPVDDPRPVDGPRPVGELGPDGTTAPTDKLNALRLGRRLVAEVSGCGPGRRAFVDVRPVDLRPVDLRPIDSARPERGRTFRLQHWDYDADRIGGSGYDVGAILMRSTAVTGDDQLVLALWAWGLELDQLRYPADTDAPQ
jgi:hypothetical protein